MSFLKLIAAGLILFGGICFWESLQAKRSGEITVFKPHGSRSGPSASEMVKRADQPELFVSAIRYQWGVAAIFIIAGGVLLRIDRHGTRWEPMAADYAGNAALESHEKEA